MQQRYEAPIDTTDAARRSAELEAAADAVMETQHLLVELDRRQNLNREGFRALKNLQKEQEEFRAQTEVERKRLAEEQARKDAGAESARTIGPDQMVTMDFNDKRLNLDTDAKGVVTAVRCG